MYLAALVASLAVAGLAHANENPCLRYLEDTLDRVGPPSCPYTPPSNIYHHVEHVRSLRLAPLCSGGRSSVECATHLKVHGVVETHCRAHDLAINIAAFRRWNEGPLRDRNGNIDSVYRVEAPPTSLTAVDCDLAPAWGPDMFGHGGQEWLYRSLGATPFRCDAYVDDDVFLMGDMYGRGNPWHTLEEVFNVFVSFAVTGMDPERAVLLIADAGPDETAANATVHPYEEVYARVLGRRPLRPLASVVRPHYAMADAVPGAMLCLRSAAFSIHGAASLLSRSATEGTTCYNSTTVKAVRAFLLDGLGLASLQADAPRPLVVYHVRNRSKVTHAAADRTPDDEPAVLRSIEDAAAEDGFEFMVVDFMSLSSGMEQFALARRASVFVGMHGGSTTHMFWMHEGRAVVDIQRGGLWGADHMENFAVWTGLRYARVSADGDHVPMRIAEQVRTSLREVRSEFRHEV